VYIKKAECYVTTNMSLMCNYYIILTRVNRIAKFPIVLRKCDRLCPWSPPPLIYREIGAPDAVAVLGVVRENLHQKLCITRALGPLLSLSKKPHGSKISSVNRLTGINRLRKQLLSADTISDKFSVLGCWGWR